MFLFLLGALRLRRLGMLVCVLRVLLGLVRVLLALGAVGNEARRAVERALIGVELGHVLLAQVAFLVLRAADYARCARGRAPVTSCR